MSEPSRLDRYAIRQLAPGDVVFFSGRGLSALIIWFATLPRAVYLAAALPWPALAWLGIACTPCAAAASLLVIVASWLLSRRITHVGIVARFKGANLLFESTTLCDQPCYISGHHVRGVQAHRLLSRLTTYAGRVWVCRLTPDERLTEEETRRLTAGLLPLLGTHYSLGGALLSGTTWLKSWAAPLGLTEHKFCSQLVARALKSVGRFEDGTHSATVHPAGLARILGRTEKFSCLQRIDLG